MLFQRHYIIPLESGALSSAAAIEMTMRSESVKRHDAEGFAGMHKAGHLAAKVLDMITPHVIAGASTEHLLSLIHISEPTRPY